MRLWYGLSVALLLVACGKSQAPAAPRAHPTPTAGFALSSPAFQVGGSIPARFTCDGENSSPPLAWSGAPARTASFALVVDDPDAPGGVFTHWLLWNLPATASSLPEGVPAVEQPPGGGLQGRNGTGRPGYSGPCPPAGPPHHYRFTLIALDSSLNLPPGSTVAQLRSALAGRSIGQAELVATYQRAGR